MPIDPRLTPQREITFVNEKVVYLYENEQSFFVFSCHLQYI